MKKISIAIPLLILLALIIFNLYLTSSKSLLIAPMIGGLDSCLFRSNILSINSPDAQYTKLCEKDVNSPSFLIEATLDKMSKVEANNSKYRLGYTLNVPLLSLFFESNGEYYIDNSLVTRVVKTIENTDRPVIIYLYSNHFGINSPVETSLASRPGNLLTSSNSVMKIDKYYGVKIFPWSFVNLNNDITRLREIAFVAVLTELCKLPVKILSRVEGVTVLGELHHMFPDFQGGMGFDRDYITTDFSLESELGFRSHLVRTFGTVSKLNSFLGSEFSSFDQIYPPKKDIRRVVLDNYWDHSDAYAHGVLPISGWIARNYNNGNEKNWIQIFDNGSFVGRVAANQGRQDVLTVHSKMFSADVGWQYNYQFRDVPHGFHQIDVFLENAPGTPLTLLSSRKIAIMKKTQEPPRNLPLITLPTAISPDISLLFNVDHPHDQDSFYFNPLVVLWNEYRELQVKSYLDHFSKLAKGKCINPDLVFSHQILPFVNPSWDEAKFAVGRELAVPDDMSLGVSLYGEASYGKSFFDWFRTTRRASYGVTEFHPLRAMDEHELDVVFESHAKENAKFISFFVESVGLDEDPTNRPNIFSFDPHNPNAGSDVLYRSVQRILN